MAFHYLGGSVHVELELPLSLAPDVASAESLVAAFADAAKEEPDVAGVRLLFSVALE